MGNWAITTRSRILIFAAIGLGISAWLFQDVFILSVFLVAVGILLEEFIWIEVVSLGKTGSFRFSRTCDEVKDAVPLSNFAFLYVDDEASFEFYFITTVTIGGLRLYSDLEFQSFRPDTVTNKQKVTKIRADFKTPFSGEYTCRSLTVEATSPLKLFRKKISTPAEIEYSVYPKTVEVAIESARLFAKGGIGENPIDMPGIGTEFYELRKYYVGDDYRLINWKASARRGELIVNEKMKEIDASYYIVLDARAKDYYDRDRLAATFLQLANTLANLNTPFGVVVHNGRKVSMFSKLAEPRASLTVAFNAALKFADIPSARGNVQLGERQEELMAIPYYKVRSNERRLQSQGLTLLAQIEMIAQTSLRQSVHGDTEDPIDFVLKLVREAELRGESKPPSILYLSALYDSMGKVVEIASEVRRIYGSEFIVLSPTAPWVVAPSEEKAYDAYMVRKKNLRVLANCGIEYYVGSPVTITRSLFGTS